MSKACSNNDPARRKTCQKQVRRDFYNRCASTANTFHDELPRRWAKGNTPARDVLIARVGFAESDYLLD
ncbi:MAG: hypothetical protein ACYSWQ_01905 [Planctomycetota bacterium]